MPIQQPDTETARRLAAFLNSLLEADREAVSALLLARVPCNGTMADHPTVQVDASREERRVGFLGVLNGFLGIHADGFGPLVAQVESLSPDAQVVRFYAAGPGGAELETAP